MGTTKSQDFRFVAGKAGQRLDVFLAESLADTSRAATQRLIKEGNVRHNGQLPKASARVEAGDTVEVTVPPPTAMDARPQWMALDIVYEDADVVAVNKPAGMTVHPGAGHADGTLVNALLAQVSDLSGIGGVERPGIVHRLDKDTSGIILVAKNDVAHRELARQFKEREMRKTYVALVRGYPTPAEAVIDAAIARDTRNRKRMAVSEGGRGARTGYKVIEMLEGCSLVEAHPETGRTHQIRVHMASVGHPIIGDALYGGRSPLSKRQLLHAHHLMFRHPRSGDEMTVTAALAGDMAEVLVAVGGDMQSLAHELL